MKMYLATKSDFPASQQFQRTVTQRGFPVRLLLSYHYIKHLSLTNWIQEHFTAPYPDVFLDSGAYSAMTLGTKLSLEGYANYIHTHKAYISVYANFDVICNAKKSLEHQRILEDQYDLAPLPVFHATEDWFYLEYYLDRYPYIALGVTGSRTTHALPWLLKCFQMAEGKQAVFHGFGISAYLLMKTFPWHSIDSTAWLEGKKFHHASLFNAETGAFEEVRFGNRFSCYEKAGLLRKLGFAPEAFINHDALSPGLLRELGAVSYYSAATWMGQYHKREKVS